ncbi:MAG: ribosome biogenesis GTPase YlqF [Lachnospiraceae bacterium]|nr:ribosome biogenesis GTPase YlqF [Lachnospiraceae bacterium]
MNIQWYPGHMTKARRAMQEDLKLVDAIVELRDARIPYSSSNPDLAELGKGKMRIIVFSKADMADPAVTEVWVRLLTEEGCRVVSMDARNGKEAKAVLGALNQAAEEKRARDRKRGIKNRPLRLMVVGIPNVGKSTLINSLAGRASAKTGDKPGVTKGRQWIRLSASLELLDTPGILWPKFEDETVGQNLALIGSVNEEVLERTELAVIGFARLKERCPERIKEIYGLEEEDPYDFLEALARRQAILKKGGEADTERTAMRFLDDLRKGKLGRLSLEVPKEQHEERE